MSKNGLMSISDAVSELGLREQRKAPEVWLRRALRAKEIEHRVKLLHASSGGKRVVYRVNLSMVRKYMPEFVDAPDKIATVVREPLRQATTAIQGIEERLETIETNIELLTKSHRELVALWRTRPKSAA